MHSAASDRKCLLQKLPKPRPPSISIIYQKHKNVTYKIQRSIVFATFQYFVMFHKLLGLTRLTNVHKINDKATPLPCGQLMTFSLPVYTQFVKWTYVR